MHTFTISLIAMLATTTWAARPENTTICDYYTPLITGKKNSAASQQEAMLIITHTFILGNYTQPNVGISVHGVATPGVFDGQDVYLLPYFTGGYASTNDGGRHGVAKNFLDDGGAVPLTMNSPANGTHSNQYDLLTHVYQYFGTFYGCSHQGEPGFPSYQGRTSMYEVHKYMDTDKFEWGFFTKQIVDAVASLGFDEADVKFTNDGLHATFGDRCSPPATVIPPDAEPELQAICVAGNCPLSERSTCGAYPGGGPVEQPVIADANLVGNVTKVNEASAAPTANWPIHCVAERDGSSTTCSFASGSATRESAPSATGEGGAEAVRGDLRPVFLIVVATAMAVSVGGSLILF